MTTTGGKNKGTNIEKLVEQDDGYERFLNTMNPDEDDELGVFSVDVANGVQNILKRKKTKSFDGMPEIVEKISKKSSSDTNTSTAGESVAIEVDAENLPDWYEKQYAKNSSESTAEDGVQAITVVNMVTVAEMNLPIDCDFSVARGHQLGMKYNPSVYAAIVIRHKNPKATTLLFKSGVITTTGAKEFKTALFLTQKVIDDLKELKDSCGMRPYKNLRCEKLRIENFVANTTLFFCLDLKKLKKLPFVRYEKQEFTGAIIELRHLPGHKYKGRNMTVLAFENGSILFTGSKSKEEVREIFDDVFPYLAQCAIVDKAKRANIVTKDQKLRIKADQAKLRLTNSDSTTVMNIATKKRMDQFNEIQNKEARIEQSRISDSRANSASVAFSLMPNSGDIACMGQLQQQQQKQQQLVVGTRKDTKQNRARNAIALVTMKNEHNEKQLQKQQLLMKVRSGGFAISSNVLQLGQNKRKQAQAQLDTTEKRAMRTKHMSDEEAFTLAAEIEN